MAKSYFGKGSISNLPDILSGLDNVLVFCCKQSFIKAGMKDALEPQLLGKNITYYSDFSVNPKEEEQVLALSKIGKQKFDVIIAIGGGSIIDFAKIFKFSYDSNLSIRDYFSGKDYQFSKETPFIAIPTTAGTGAEATRFAVVYVDGKKQSLEDEKIKPAFSIIDSQFLETLPRYLKASTAMDAYCQAIESYWSVNATRESLGYSTKAISFCRKSLVSYVNDGDSKSCEDMAEASHLAGMAINISKTTISHALSYFITSKYGIPHGHAVALSIARLFRENLDVVPERLQNPDDYAFILGKMNKLLDMIGIEKNQVVSYFEELFSKIGLEFSLSKLGIHNVSEIADDVNIQRMKNNPVKMSRNDLMELFSK